MDNDETTTTTTTATSPNNEIISSREKQQQLQSQQVVDDSENNSNNNNNNINNNNENIDQYSDQQDDELEKDQTNIFVKHLPNEFTDLDLENLFSKYGNVKSSKVMIDIKGNSYGYGFVRFSNPSESAAAIQELDGYQYQNKKLLCRLSNLYTNLNSKNPSNNLFIKPLPHDVTDEQLKKLFEPFGRILECKVMLDHNGQSKFAGFVRFSNEVDASKAIESMNGIKINKDSSYPLVVKYSDTEQQKIIRKQKKLQSVYQDKLLIVNSQSPTQLNNSNGGSSINSSNGGGQFIQTTTTQIQSQQIPVPPQPQTLHHHHIHHLSSHNDQSNLIDHNIINHQNYYHNNYMDPYHNTMYHPSHAYGHPPHSQSHSNEIYQNQSVQPPYGYTQHIQVYHHPHTHQPIYSIYPNNNYYDQIPQQIPIHNQSQSPLSSPPPQQHQIPNSPQPPNIRKSGGFSNNNKDININTNTKKKKKNFKQQQQQPLNIDNYNNNINQNNISITSSTPLNGSSSSISPSYNLSPYNISPSEPSSPPSPFNNNSNVIINNNPNSNNKKYNKQRQQQQFNNDFSKLNINSNNYNTTTTTTTTASNPLSSSSTSISSITSNSSNNTNSSNNNNIIKPINETNLFVFHLPPFIDDNYLFQLFSQFGKLQSVRVITDKNTGENKGYGFVKFFNRDEALKCQKEMNGFRIGSKYLKVKLKNPTIPSPSLSDQLDTDNLIDAQSIDNDNTTANNNDNNDNIQINYNN